MRDIDFSGIFSSKVACKVWIFYQRVTLGIGFICTAVYSQKH